MNNIGKYQILEELGRGGMGAVFRAHDSLMDREVALKVILDEAMAIPEIKARFYREAQTAGKLAHENITTIYDVGEDHGRPYIVMEYLPGYDLRAIVDKKRPLSLLQKLDLAVQIARGLAFSHSRNIIHRDIKPANIRIIDERKVKIIDFGIAKQMSSSLTSSGAVIGTPYYMSPEQIQGKKVDKRSDIFSYGVLLYELLTYHKPFTGSEPTAVMYKIVHEPPEHLEELEKHFPPALKALVAKLLEKEPELRYQSLDLVVEDLEGIASWLGGGQRKRFEEQRKKFDKLIADAREYMSKGRFEEATRAVEQAAAIDPANSQLGRVRAEIHVAEAEETKRTAIAAKIAAGREHLEGNRFREAIEVAKEILALDARNPDGIQLLEVCNDRLAACWLVEAQASFEKGDLKNAESLAEETLELIPDHDGARELLTLIQAEQRTQVTKHARSDVGLTGAVEEGAPPKGAVPPAPAGVRAPAQGRAASGPSDAVERGSLRRVQEPAPSRQAGMKSVATRKVSLPRWLVIAVSSVAIVSGSVLVVLLMQRETPRQENSSNAIRPAESKKGTETEKPRETRDTVSQFVEVPDLITMSIEDATALVQNLGLRAVPLGSARSDDEKGKVFKTFPKSGARIERGKTITLHYGE